MTRQAIFKLRDAWAIRKPTCEAHFGVTAKACSFHGHAGTTFRWRDYVSGDEGAIAWAPEREACAVALALLDELHRLRGRKTKAKGAAA